MNKGKQLKHIYDTLKVGDKISVYRSTEASYSNYAGNPTIFFHPENVATVTHIHVPCVVHGDKYKNEFVRASFWSIATEWSVALDYRNIKVINQE